MACEEVPGDVRAVDLEALVGGAVGIIGYDGVTLLDVSGPAEVLARAGGYRITMLSARGGTVTASNGLALAGTVPVADAPDLHTVLVPGGDLLAGSPLPADLLSAAGDLVARSSRVAAVCTGAFVLAELGLLDGRRATTHWRHAEALRRRYPRVHVEPDLIQVSDGPCWTSAGISAGIDLALALVEHDRGAYRARAVARELVMHMSRPAGQLQFARRADVPDGFDPRLRRVLDRMAEAPAHAGPLDALAADVSLSARQLARLFTAQMGTTPGHWLETLRMERAQSLLLEGAAVTTAALEAGFGSDESLRRTLRKRLGITPSEYRERFTSTTAP